MKERNKAVPAVYLFLRKGKEILLMRRQGSGYYDGWYSVPAGHVEAGELPLEGLVREVHEELGITINENDARLVHAMYRTKHDDTGDRADLFFVVSRWVGEILNAESHKCDDIRWFPLKNLPNNMMPHVKDALEKVEKGIIYSELGVGYIQKISPAQGASK